MKKSLIALALVALPVAAMADVTLYDQIKAGIEVPKVKLGEQTVARLDYEKSSETATEITGFGSRISFKGHEYLDNNLNAIWQIEQNISIANGDKERASRGSFTSLEDSLGKICASKLNSAAKDSSDNVDQWESSNGALNMFVFTRVDERTASAHYGGPVFSGFSASVQYTPCSNASPSDKYTHNDATRGTYYTGLSYEDSGFFGQRASDFRKNAAPGKDGHVRRLIGGYGANNLFVSVAGQYAKDREASGDYVRTQSSGVVTSAMCATGASASNVMFGTAAGLDSHPAGTIEVTATVAYRAGNVAPRASYAHGFKAKANGEKLKGTQYDQVIVGADYNFSKRTTALASTSWLCGAESGPHRVKTISSLVGLRYRF